MKISARIHAMAYDGGTHLPVRTEQDDPTSGPFQPRIYVHDQIPPEKNPQNEQKFKLDDSSLAFLHFFTLDLLVLDVLRDPYRIFMVTGK